MLSWIKLEHLEKWTGGKLTGPEGRLISVPSISTDSRSVKPGEVFVALKGENFDGNEYVFDVAKRGAAAAIVSVLSKAPIPQILVSDTNKALVAIGEAIRDAFKGPVFAVTGSAGKSSTKEMIADLMGESTVRSPKSFNNLWGVPRTLFLVEDRTQNLVLEMGMNALGEIREICKHFKPTAGLITNIGDAHIGKLGGQEKIYEAKKELFDALAQRNDPGSQVALNLDDPLIVKAYEAAFKNKPQTVTYSVNGTKADVQVHSRSMDPQTGALSLEMELRGNRAKLDFPLFGLHQADNIAAASAAALLLGLPSKDILARLPGLKSTSQRGELIGLPEGRTLIDESYNSNPSALIASLSSVAELDPSRRRVLVLGEMRELGDFSDEQHTRAGKALVNLYLKRKFPFVLVGVGNGFLPFLTAVERELPGVPCVGVPDTAHAIERLRALVLPSDIVLVKGSRGVALEAVVQWLKG